MSAHESPAVVDDLVEWTENPAASRLGTMIRIDLASSGVDFLLGILVLAWWSGQRPYVWVGFLMVVFGIFDLYIHHSHTVIATGVSWKALHLKTRNGETLYAFGQIEQARRRQTLSAIPALEIKTQGKRREQWFALPADRIEALTRAIEKGKREAAHRTARPAGEPPQAPALPAAGPLSWVIAILPDGRTVPDGGPLLTTHDTDPAALPTGTWISESPRQQVGVQVMARIILLGVFIGPIVFLVDQELGLGLSRSQFFLVTGGAAILSTMALRKPLKLGGLGKSRILLSEAFEDLGRVDELVRKAVAQGGWRIESVDNEGSSRTWRLDIPLHLWYFRSERPTRRYLILETDGLEHQEAHARLKGQILAALGPAPAGSDTSATSPRSPDKAS